MTGPTFSYRLTKRDKLLSVNGRRTCPECSKVTRSRIDSLLASESLYIEAEFLIHFGGFYECQKCGYQRKR